MEDKQKTEAVMIGEKLAKLTEKYCTSEVRINTLAESIIYHEMAIIKEKKDLEIARTETHLLWDKITELINLKETAPCSL